LIRKGDGTITPVSYNRSSVVSAPAGEGPCRCIILNASLIDEVHQWLSAIDRKDVTAKAFDGEATKLATREVASTLYFGQMFRSG
jgi:hypothetical protein